MRFFVGRDVGIGDMVMANQVVKSLKSKYPLAHITFGCGPSPNPELLETNPYIDKIISFPDNGHPKRALRRAEEPIRKFAKENSFDKIFLLFPHDHFAFECLERKIHLIEYYAELAEVELEERRPLLYITDEDRKVADEIIKKYGVDDNFVVINHMTFYTSGPKQWPLEKFQRLVNNIRKDQKTVVVVGSKDDPPLENAINILGEPIRSVAEIISKCFLYIGLDSGLTHIASLFDIPIISIHPSTFPEVTGAISESVAFIRGEEINGVKYVVAFEKVWEEAKKYL